MTNQTSPAIIDNGKTYQINVGTCYGNEADYRTKIEAAMCDSFYFDHVGFAPQGGSSVVWVSVKADAFDTELEAVSAVLRDITFALYTS